MLRVTSPEGTAIFTLGAAAEKWAHKIRNPRSLADKLDIKAGVRVSLCGLSDAGFREQVAARTADVSEGSGETIGPDFSWRRSRTGLVKTTVSVRFDQIQWGDLGGLPERQESITEGEVLAAGKQAGLVDIKVARFSETHTALKFVIPVAKRTA